MEPILIVEDDELLANLLKRLLEQENHQAYCADNIHDGLVLAHQYNPSMAIVDLRLPGGNGFLLIEQLRSDPRFENLIILILTADLTPEARSKANDMGCIIFAKPLPYVQLAITITNLLLNTDSA